jgi:hypothetical protein
MGMRACLDTHAKRHQRRPRPPEAAAVPCDDAPIEERKHREDRGGHTT